VLSAELLARQFPEEWREFKLVEHGRRVRDASLDEDGSAVRSIALPSVALPALAAPAPAPEAMGRWATTSDGVGVGEHAALYEQRRRFADQLTRAMPLADYVAYAETRCRGLSNGGFMRLTACNLRGIVDEWGGLDERQGFKELPKDDREGREAVHFFLKLCLVRVADLVQRANVLAHDGAFEPTRTPLPLAAYEEASHALLATTLRTPAASAPPARSATAPLPSRGEGSIRPYKRSRPTPLSHAVGLMSAQQGVSFRWAP